jgi:hypothetical protein
MSINEEPVGSLDMPLEYANELYTLCKKIDEEVGTNNGATALYWHLQTVFSIHLQKQD